MVASSILQQPNPSNAVNFIVAAYRQVIFEVLADSLVPNTQPMYADVYFYSAFATGFPIYYKTLSAYSITVDSGTGHSIFYFDIHDALQEYLTLFIPSITTAFPIQTDSAPPLSNAHVQVWFRGSTITNGILIPQSPVPVQATYTTPATSPYTGLGANGFNACNASILSNYADQYQNDYEPWMKTWQVNDASGFIATTRIFTLSNLPYNSWANPISDTANYMMDNYNGYVGMIILQFGVSGSLSRLSRNCALSMAIYDGTTYLSVVPVIASIPNLTVGTYYLPVGGVDLFALLSGADKTYLLSIAASGNCNYRLVLYDTDAGMDIQCWVSPLYKFVHVNPTAVGQFTCLWFQNLHGHFETITFVRAEEDYITKSGQLLTPYSQTVPDSINPLQIGLKRYNTRSNDEITLTALFNEELMPWLKQLISSPYAMMQQPNNSLQPFIAVVILDGTFKTKKKLTEQGIKYETSIKIRPAIDTIQIRN